MAGSLAGFDPADFIANIRLAMGIGQTDPAPLFSFAHTTASTAPQDETGVPFDVDATVTVAAVKPPVSPPCAVEYQDSAGVVTHLATVAASRAVLTLLGPDYALVAGFTSVLMDGIAFSYQHTETPQNLGSVAVYRVHVISEGQR